MSEKYTNEVIFTVREGVELMKEKLNRDNAYIVELDGAHILTWEDYISEIQNKFKFPTHCYDSIDRYLDWMRDLEWLKKEEIVLIINNYNEFMRGNIDLKNQIVEDFSDIILPFWQNEVKEVVVNGKSKLFKVFLVN